MGLVKSLNKDHFGGTLLVVLGVAITIGGFSYHRGTLNHMGAGFIPVALGVLMTLVGAAVFVTAITDTAPAAAGDGSSAATHGAHGSGKPEWRGWLCILGGVIAFVVLGSHGGLVPATFASVFVSAKGDRQNTWRGAAGLAALITVFGVIVFHYGLSLQLPLFAWGA